MVTWAVAMLLYMSGSGVGDVASARMVALPGAQAQAQARTVTVSVAVASPASAGRVQVAVSLSPVQCGAHAVAVSTGGSRMLAVTAAASGPALATARVQVPWWPAVMAAGQDRAAETSALYGW